MVRSAMPTDPAPTTFKVIVDSREQCPYDTAPMISIAGTLAAGDYSIVGLENQIAIERKSLEDYIGCCAQERDRFERELQRLLAYPTRCVVVEAAWLHLERHTWRSKITPASVIGSTLGWISQGVPILFAGDRAAGQAATMRMLFIAARRHYRTLRTFSEAISNTESAA